MSTYHIIIDTATGTILSADDCYLIELEEGVGYSDDDLIADASAEGVSIETLLNEADAAARAFDLLHDALS